MSQKCVAPNEVTEGQLVAHALGQFNPIVAAHIEYCPVCCDEVELYRSILRSTHQVFNGEVRVAHVVACKSQAQNQNLLCEVDGPMRNLSITMRPEDGQLTGRVLCENDQCECLTDAPIRLFGNQGYVACDQVDDEGHFRFPPPDPSQRYSLGLVLTDEIDAELQIIGDFSFPA